MQKKITNIFLFFTPALVFSFPGSYWLGALLFAAIGFFTVVQQKISFGKTIELVREVPAVWGFSIYVLIHVFLVAYHGDPAKDFGSVIPFLLSPLILIAVVTNEPNSRHFWLGCAAGALVAFLIAVTQIYVFDAGRAFGFRNPILFGDTAIVLGTGALVGLFFCRSVFTSFSEKVFLFTCGLAGLFTSLLSGTKGGWLSLIMIIVLLANAVTRSMHIVKRVSLIAGCFLILFAVIILVPKLPVVDRVISAYHGTVEWVENGNVTEGSASIRLESFKAGLMVGVQSPIVGLGKQGEQVAFREAVDAGSIRKEMIEVNVVDNDFISVFSKHGLLGVFGIIAVHLGVFCTFWRYRTESDDAVKAITSMGVLLVLFYTEFGLTVSIFGTSIFRTMYISWSILLAGLLISEKRRLASVASVA
jgi:O-antigen ligase